jgi:F420-non-reducing hydrogenase iron-sulfur subunit
MAHEPVILGFLCNWCSYRAADYAGTSRLHYAPHLRVVRVMCSGRVEPQFVLQAFRSGADGVLISGCQPGTCHYMEGNIKALQRYLLLKRLLTQFGIAADRFEIVWASAAEGAVLAARVDAMVRRLRQLGPFAWDGGEQEVSA